MTTPKIRTPRGRLSHLQAAAGADAWTSKERILLIEIVMQLGTDDWGGISKAMHEHTNVNRSKEWCSPHNCTREYQVAVESATKIVRHRGFTGGGADLLMQIRNYYIEDRINKLKVEEAEQRKRYLDLLKFQQEVDEGQHEDKLDDLYDAYEAAGVAVPEEEDSGPVNYGALSELAAMSGRMSMILSIINQVIGRTPEVIEEPMETSEMKPETPSAGLAVEDEDFNDLLACLPNVGAFEDDLDPSLIDDTNLFQSPTDSSRRSTGVSPKGSPQKRSLGTTPTDDDRLRSMPPPSSAPTLSLLLGMPTPEPGQRSPDFGLAKIPESITTTALQGRSPSHVGYSTPPSSSPSRRDSPTKLSSSPTLQRLLEGTMFKKESTEENALEEMAVQAIVSGAAEKMEARIEIAPAEVAKKVATPVGIEVKVTATIVSAEASVLETSAASEPMDILEPGAVQIQDVTDAPASVPAGPVVSELRARSSPRKAKLTEIVRSDSIPELEINNKPVSPVQSSHSPRKTLPVRVEIPPIESRSVKEEIVSPRKPEAKASETESKKTADKEEERMEISESEQDVKPEVESEDELRVTKPELTYSKKDLSGESPHEQVESEDSDVETSEKSEETPLRLMSPRTRSPATVPAASPSKRGRKPKTETATSANEASEEERMTRARRSQHSSPAPMSKTPKSTLKAEEDPNKDAAKPTRATRSRISVTPAASVMSTSTPGPDVKPALPAPKIEKELASGLDIEPPSARLNRSRVSSVSRAHDLSHLESNPSSPSSTTTTSTTMDDDKEYKVFKKSIIFLWEQIKTHKHAGQFLKPITDASVPTYSQKVLRPMDLSTLKRSIDHGQIRTVQAFEREIYLMFMNAIMYNTYSHEIHQRTLEMESDVRVLIDQYKAAQKTLKGGSANRGDAADGNTSLTRSPVKLRNRTSMRRSIKKSESEHDETGIDSGTHTPISMTDTEFDDGDSDRLGRKTRDNSPDVTHHAPRRGRPPLKRNLDRTPSTDAAHASSEVSTPKPSD